MLTQRSKNNVSDAQTVDVPGKAAAGRSALGAVALSSLYVVSKS